MFVILFLASLSLIATIALKVPAGVVWFVAAVLLFSLTAIILLVNLISQIFCRPLPKLMSGPSGKKGAL